MKYLASIILSALVVTTSWASQNYSVNVVEQAQQKWRFQHVFAYTSNGETVVRGRLTSHKRSGLPRGHVDVAAYSSSGELIAETTTNHILGMMSRTQKKRGGARFSASFEKKLPADAVIKLAFHRATSESTPTTMHSNTIAK